MKLLIAEDDVFFRRLLQHILDDDYELVLAEDGTQAWDALQQPDGPRLAILDWVMPGLSGPQVCRKVRGTPELGASCYLIILTARNSAADVLSGLRAGADDYVTKPFDAEELRARIRIGKRIIQLDDAVAVKTAALEDALQRERELTALVPVCPRCRRIRSDGAYWADVERYLTKYSRNRESGCPACTLEAAAAVTELVTVHEALQ
jgi:phosphoserine phosphatase RsbU/P